MTSRKIRLTTVAPLVVAALAAAAALPAKAQDMSTAIYAPSQQVSSQQQLIARSLPLGLRHVTGSPYGSTHARRIASAVPIAESPLEETTSVVSRPSEGAAPVERNLQAAKLFSDPGTTDIASKISESPQSELPVSMKPVVPAVAESQPALSDLKPLIPLIDPKADANASTNGSTNDLAGSSTQAATISENNQTAALPPDAVQGVKTESTEQKPGDYDMNLEPITIAQSVPTDTIQETGNIDLTPVSLPRRQPNFNRFEGMKSQFLYGLPGKMFFSAVIDNSLRLETNVFQTAHRRKSDMVYRILPNTTLGYALGRYTRVSANYFFLRDQYTHFSPLLNRNFHSVGFQVDQDLPLKGRTRVTFGFLGRALFADPDQFSDVFFNDLLPQATITHQIGNSTILYSSIMGQIRFREMLSKFQEGDQFYAFGLVHQRGKWSVLIDNTLNNNFGNSNLRLGHNNQVFILTQEVARRLTTQIPLQLYFRTQEIFNMGANASPGYAGYNFRVFGGLRLTIAKPVIFPVRIKD